MINLRISTEQTHLLSINKNLTKVALICSLLLSTNIYALYPRTYIAAPAGTFILASYYYHIESNDLYADNDKLKVDLNASRDLGIIRPIYYFDWLDTRFAVNALISYADDSLHGSAAGGRHTSSGSADPILHGGFFLINDPANRLWLGLSEYISLPLGEYNNNNILNPGENRYKGKTELGLAKGFGQYHLDVTASMTVYGSNTDFSSHSDKLEQNTLWGMETHISRNITSHSYIALGTLWQWGGKTKINGIRRHDRKNKFSMQISYDHFLSRHHKPGMIYNKDLEVDNGFKLDTVSLRYSYIF